MSATGSFQTLLKYCSDVVYGEDSKWGLFVVLMWDGEPSQYLHESAQQLPKKKKPTQYLQNWFLSRKSLFYKWPTHGVMAATIHSTTQAIKHKKGFAVLCIPLYSVFFGKHFLMRFSVVSKKYPLCLKRPWNASPLHQQVSVWDWILLMNLKQAGYCIRLHFEVRENPALGASVRRLGKSNASQLNVSLGKYFHIKYNSHHTWNVCKFKADQIPAWRMEVSTKSHPSTRSDGAILQRAKMFSLRA